MPKGINRDDLTTSGTRSGHLKTTGRRETFCFFAGDVAMTLELCIRKWGLKLLKLWKCFREIEVEE